MISLWVATSYLVKTKKKKITSLLTAIPATFMTAVSVTYILVAKEGFKLSTAIGYPAGLCAAAASFTVYVILLTKTVRRSHR